jgi:bacterioferritin (cytochrome b1)
MKIIRDLVHISQRIVDQISLNQSIEWNYDMEQAIRSYAQFVSNVHDYIQNESLHLTEVDLSMSILEIPVFHFQTYRKLYAISFSGDYWKLSTETREILENFYSKEEEYADEIEKMPTVGFIDAGVAANESVKCNRSQDSTTRIRAVQAAPNDFA